MKERPPSIRVIWPPPGLESYQGAFWTGAGRIGFGAAVLVFPVLLSLSFSQPFNSMGPLGPAWWVLGLTSLFGLLMFLRGLTGLLGFFRNARRAALHGIDLETILQVSADAQGDMGTLLQGTRTYRSLDEAHRARAVRARIWASLLFLSGATWITIGWALSLVLAGRGLVGPTGVWVLTLGPSGALLMTGAVAKGLEGTAVQGALGPLFWNRWRTSGQTDAARLWGEEMGRARIERGERVTSGRGALLAGAVSVIALAIFVFVPTASFIVASSVGPVIATAAIPRFPSVERKAGEAEALRHLRLPPDPGVLPLEAGEALHAIVSAGQKNRDPRWMKDPVREFEASFISRHWENPLGLDPQKWATGLFPMILEGVTPEGEAFLRQIASHPGLKEFETLAHAQAVDVLGARLVLPLVEGASGFDIPIPRVSSLREGGYALVAKAALQLLEGNPDGAEGTLRTVLSAGFLLAEDAPTLIDALVGVVLVSNAGDALESLYQATGRQEDAEALQWIRESTRRATEVVRGGVLGWSSHSAVRSMPARVNGKGTLRGVRWEYFHILAGISPCINANQVVFGPDKTLTDFLQSARASLVRYPSEAAVFDLIKKGWSDLPTRGGLEAALARMIKVTLGSRAGNCAEVLASGML